MPRRVGTCSKAELVGTPLPQATKSYTVISHRLIIDSIIDEVINVKGFELVNEKYVANVTGEVAYGVLYLNYGDDPDLNMMVSFTNSYDKSLRFRCAVGAYVNINKGCMLSNNMSVFNRKHTGTADQEAVKAIKDQIADAELYFDQLVQDKEIMKKVILTDRKLSELIGSLYMELKVLSGEQLNLIRKEYETPSYDYTTDKMSLWTIYNHIIVTLKKSHPKHWMDQQKIIHSHIMTEYSNFNFDVDNTLTENEVYSPKTIQDPNQLDLVQSIAEIEAENTKEVVEPKPLPILPGFGAAPANPIKEVIEAVSEPFIKQQEDITPVEEPEESVTESSFEEAVSTDFEKNETDVFAEEENMVIEVNGEFVNEEDETELITIPKHQLEAYAGDIEEGSVVDVEGIPCEVVMSDDENYYLAQLELDTEHEVVLEPVVEEEIPMPHSGPGVVEVEPETQPEVHLTEDELSNQLYGVDNNPESVIYEEEIEEEDEDDLPTAEEEPYEEDSEVEEVMDEEVVDEEETDNPIRQIISQEIYDLYDTVHQFTYVLKDNQYIVTLESGEVIILLQKAIDERAETIV